MSFLQRRDWRFNHIAPRTRPISPEGPLGALVGSHNKWLRFIRLATEILARTHGSFQEASIVGRGLTQVLDRSCCAGGRGQPWKISIFRKAKFKTVAIRMQQVAAKYVDTA